MAIHTRVLPVPTHTPYRLGRHKKHDDESWNHRIALPERRQDITTVWTYSKPVLNQWDTNGCTGNSIAHLFNTDFMAPTRARKGVDWLTEKDALNFYSVGTHEEDDSSDYYPPNDNGSNGLDVSQAAVQLGWADRFQHAFGFDDFRAALQKQPVCVGTIWTNEMFETDSNYVMHPGSLADDNVAGGHEYLALEIHYDVRLIWFLTSWGADFARRGMFALSFNDFEALLDQEGDVVAPHGIAQAA